MTSEVTPERTPGSPPDRARLVAAGALLTEAASLLAAPRPPVAPELHPELTASFGPLHPLAASLAEHEPEILVILGTEPLPDPAAPLEACPTEAREALEVLAGFLAAMTSGPAAARDRAWRVVAEAVDLAATSGRTFAEVWSWPAPPPPPPRSPLPRRADDPAGWDAACAALALAFGDQGDEEQARTATPAPPLWPEDLDGDPVDRVELVDRVEDLDGEQVADPGPEVTR